MYAQYLTEERSEEMKKILLASLLITIIVSICTTICTKGETFVQTQYTIKEGDTLYSIAEDYGVKDWRKWVYETRKANNITNCGALQPGQIITIEVKE